MTELKQIKLHKQSRILQFFQCCCPLICKANKEQYCNIDETLNEILHDPNGSQNQDQPPRRHNSPKHHSLQIPRSVPQAQYKNSQTSQIKFRVLFNHSRHILGLYKKTEKVFRITLMFDSNFRLRPINFFSLAKDLKIQFNTEDFIWLAPEPLVQYLSYRCQGIANTIIDISNSSGIFAINFARLGMQVINVSDSFRDNENCKHNSEVFRMQNQIESIASQFRHQKWCSRIADLVFVDLSDKKRFNHFKDYFIISQRLSNNIIMLLPAQFNITAMDYIDPFTSIEVERIVINQQHEYSVLYVGRAANMTNAEKIIALNNLITQYDRSMEGRVSDILFQITEQYGLDFTISWVEELYLKQAEQIINIIVEEFQCLGISTTLNNYSHKTNQYDDSINDSSFYSNNLNGYFLK